MPSRPVSAVKRRLAISAFMLVFGIGMASWVVRTPAVRDLLAASTAEMGLVLLGLSVGSMSGVLSSATVVRRQGVRFTVVIGGASFVTGIALTGVFAELSTPFGVAAGLALVGFGIGISEIALNVEGAALETLTGRSVLPALHGFYSLGTVTGAVTVPGPNFTAANGVTYTNLPSFCKVSVVMMPTTDSFINVELWLPVSSWNGKFQGIGNGGYAGTIQQGLGTMVTGLQYRLDVNTLHRDETATSLGLNEIGRISLRVTQQLFVDDYSRNRLTGGFILIDEATNATVGAGMIIDAG